MAGRLLTGVGVAMFVTASSLYSTDVSNVLNRARTMAPLGTLFVSTSCQAVTRGWRVWIYYTYCSTLCSALQTPLSLFNDHHRAPTRHRVLCWCYAGPCYRWRAHVGYWHQQHVLPGRSDICHSRVGDKCHPDGDSQGEDCAQVRETHCPPFDSLCSTLLFYAFHFFKVNMVCDVPFF